MKSVKKLSSIDQFIYRTIDLRYGDLDLVDKIILSTDKLEKFNNDWIKKIGDNLPNNKIMCIKDRYKLLRIVDKWKLKL